MDSWVIPAFVGGITGGIAAYGAVSKLNAKCRANPCPRCGTSIINRPAGRRTRVQYLWGGWTCPDCGCDVDRLGNERLPAKK
jgi:predicted RNA-binding Zn-ribbon protein involved in translation (DUF1610 family)